MAQGETDIIQQRDILDSQRTSSPLVRLEDACYIDSSALTVGDMVAIALRHLADCGLAATSAQAGG